MISSVRNHAHLCCMHHRVALISAPTRKYIRAYANFTLESIELLAWTCRLYVYVYVERFSLDYLGRLRSRVRWTILLSTYALQILRRHRGDYDVHSMNSGGGRTCACIFSLCVQCSAFSVYTKNEGLKIVSRSSRVRMQDGIRWRPQCPSRLSSEISSCVFTLSVSGVKESPDARQTIKALRRGVMGSCREWR